MNMLSHFFTVSAYKSTAPFPTLLQFTPTAYWRNIKQIVLYAEMNCQPVWLDEGYDGRLIAYYYKPETEKAWNYWKANK